MLIVVKVGGSIIHEGSAGGIFPEVKELTGSHKLIIIHGGGAIVTEMSRKLGKEPKFIKNPKGFRSRYTDKEEADIYTMVMAGRINKELVSEFQKNGVNAIGLTGLDGALIRADRKEQIIAVDERGRKMLVEGDYTGKITTVNAELLRMLLDAGYTPVVSPLAMGGEAEALNVDGDRTAAAVAAAVKADALILLTDVEGLKLNDKLVENLSLIEAEQAVKGIGAGMITKVYAAIEGVKGGAGEALIASGSRSRALTLALAHDKCTVIRK
jgi:acetylglutamate/LysW-gamma-L-alpha-aminoadipate kinase